jgi:protein-tyrosine-phosphatase
MKIQSKTSRKPYHIHFVCTGNAYRSRLAEAYLKSLNLKRVKASSSGIEASKHENGPISWYAERIAAHQGLLKHVSKTKKDTRKKHLNQADLVIFLHPDNFEMFRKNFGDFTLKEYEIWDIPDLHHLGFRGIANNQKEENKLIAATEKTFMQIKAKINKLAEKLQSE